MSIEYSVDDLVPHSGTMSLLSRVTAYGDDWLEAEVDISSATLFAEEQGVPAWVGLEYLAQAIAAFSGVQEKKQNQPPKLGFLDMVAENGLHVFKGMLTAFNVEATANLNVFQPDDASQFIKEAKQ